MLLTLPQPASLDLIPDPAEVHAQIRAAARHARLLRRQLRLSLAAKTERETSAAHRPAVGQFAAPAAA